MATTGNIFPGVGENVDRAGLTAWASPGNIVSDNATDATCNGTGSDYLVARTFGFSAVPANAVISGITVRLEASEHSTGTESLNAQIQNASAALVGSSKANTVSGTAKAVYTYGGTTDVWGASPTGNMVHDADFGVRGWFTTAHDVRVDFVTMALEYTVPGPGIATETDTAFALVAKKIRAVGMCTETDTALALAVGSGGIQIPVGLSTETDSAFALAIVKRAAVGLASETDTALALSVIKRAPVGLAAETDSAFALAVGGGGVQIPVGMATETDSGFALIGFKRASVGLCTETDTALSLSITKRAPVGMAVENDTAFSLDESVFEGTRGTHVGTGIHVDMPDTWDGLLPIPAGWTFLLIQILSLLGCGAPYGLSVSDSTRDPLVTADHLVTDLREWDRLVGSHAAVPIYLTGTGDTPRFVNGVADPSLGACSELGDYRQIEVRLDAVHATPWPREAFRHALWHEMGHAMLSCSDKDHSSDPSALMFAIATVVNVGSAPDGELIERIRKP